MYVATNIAFCLTPRALFIQMYLTAQYHNVECPVIKPDTDMIITVKVFMFGSVSMVLLSEMRALFLPVSTLCCGVISEMRGYTLLLCYPRVEELPEGLSQHC